MSNEAAVRSFTRTTKVLPTPALLVTLDTEVMAVNAAASKLGFDTGNILADVFGEKFLKFAQLAARSSSPSFSRITLEHLDTKHDFRVYAGVLDIAEDKTGRTYLILYMDEGRADPREFAALTQKMNELRGEIGKRRAVEELLWTMLDTAFDGVAMIDGHGFIVEHNDAFAELFGREWFDGEPLGIRSILRSDQGNFLPSLPEGTQSSGNVRRIVDVTGIKYSGERFPLQIQISQRTLHGQRVYVLVVRDQTEQRMLQQQIVEAQKLEVIGRLAGGVAHDFNNLLTVIAGNAELLSESLQARPDLAEFAQEIGIAADRGAKLTQRLLAFSRKQLLRPVRVDINELLDNLVGIINRLIGAHNEIEVIKADAAQLVEVDAAQLEQAILNIAINAKDAMPNGGRIVIKTACTELDDNYSVRNVDVQPGPYVMISITDTGTGIEPEHLKQVFEPFFTTKETGKGTGLGLSQVFGFVKQSRGHVAVYSEVGLGTTVTIYLPAVAGKASAMSATEPVGVAWRPGAAQEEAVPTGFTVLLVEDDESVRSFTRSTLKRMGLTVIDVEDVAAALAVLAENSSIQLVLSDVALPGGATGWDLWREVRATYPDIRVVLASGYPMETMAERVTEDELPDFIQKPYSRRDLIKYIRLD